MGKEKKKKERAVKAKIAAERKRKATEKKKKVARREKRAKYVKRERAGKEKSAKARKAEKAKKAKARELSAKESKYKRRERADKAAKKRAKAEKDGKRAAAARQRRINNERRSKATCTVTAYEHNHFRGRVLSRRSTCSSLQHYHMPRSGRRRGYMASSFRLSSGCRQVQLWDEDRCRFNYGDNVNIRSSV